MPTPENKEIVKRFIDELNSHDVDRAVDLLAEDAVDHNASPGQAPGREGFRDALRELLRAYPDWQAEVEEIIAEGDRVAIRLTWTGTEERTVDWVPDQDGDDATGEQVTISSIALFSVRGGKITEHLTRAKRVS